MKQDRMGREVYFEDFQVRATHCACCVNIARMGVCMLELAVCDLRSSESSEFC